MAGRSIVRWQRALVAALVAAALVIPAAVSSAAPGDLGERPGSGELRLNPAAVDAARGRADAPPMAADRRRRAAAEALRFSTGFPSEPIGLAAGLSSQLFADDGALFAIVARSDDFPDALASSALAFGGAPVLLNDSGPALAPATRAEIERVIPPGTSVVLMGGTAVLHSALETELSAMGYHALRLGGAAREETAVFASQLVSEVAQILQTPPPGTAFLARRDDWADAVTVGGLAAAWGIPVLLTSSDDLHPVTRDELARLGAERLYVLGGTAAVGEGVEQQLAQALPGVQVSRLAGPTRTGTALEIAVFQDLLSRSVLGRPSDWAVALNVRRVDGFAFALAAAPLARFGVVAPVEGHDGASLTDDVRQTFCGTGLDVIVVGGPDLVTDAAGLDLLAAIEGDPSACRSAAGPPAEPDPLAACAAGDVAACERLFPEIDPEPAAPPPDPAPPPSGGSCRRSSYIPGLSFLAVSHPDGTTVEVQADARDFRRTVHVRHNGVPTGEFDLPHQVAPGVTALLDQRLTTEIWMGEVRQVIKQIPVLEVCDPWQGDLS